MSHCGIRRPFRIAQGDCEEAAGTGRCISIIRDSNNGGVEDSSRQAPGDALGASLSKIPSPLGQICVIY